MNPKENLAFYGFNKGGIHVPLAVTLEKMVNKIYYLYMNVYQNGQFISYGNLIVNSKMIYNVRCSDHILVYGIVNATINSKNVLRQLMLHVDIVILSLGIKITQCWCKR